MQYKIRLEKTIQDKTRHATTRLDQHRKIEKEKTKQGEKKTAPDKRRQGKTKTKQTRTRYDKAVTGQDSILVF
jgi:hypothetical protein